MFFLFKLIMFLYIVGLVYIVVRSSFYKDVANEIGNSKILAILLFPLLLLTVEGRTKLQQIILGE
jgi:hypothetical protein